MECTLRKLKQKSLTKGGERATSAEDCRRVSVGVCAQQYSVQCKGYNLIGVTTVEASETTALVYWQINSSLYTGAVQVLCSVVEYTPAGLTVSRGVASSPHAYPFLCLIAWHRTFSISNLSNIMFPISNEHVAGGDHIHMYLNHTSSLAFISSRTLKITVNNKYNIKHIY